MITTTNYSPEKLRHVHRSSHGASWPIIREVSSSGPRAGPRQTSSAAAAKNRAAAATTGFGAELGHSFCFGMGFPFQHPKLSSKLLLINQWGNQWFGVPKNLYLRNHPFDLKTMRICNIHTFKCCNSRLLLVDAELTKKWFRPRPPKRS